MGWQHDHEHIGWSQPQKAAFRALHVRRPLSGARIEARASYIYDGGDVYASAAPHEKKGLRYCDDDDDATCASQVFHVTFFGPCQISPQFTLRPTACL
jgi:hypothetical protein